MSKTKHVTDILREWLIERGYQGLCNDDCGCGVDDLCPCLEISHWCEPAYRHVCECEHYDEEWCDTDGGHCWRPEPEPPGAPNE